MAKKCLNLLYDLAKQLIWADDHSSHHQHKRINQNDQWQPLKMTLIGSCCLCQFVQYVPLPRSLCNKMLSAEKFAQVFEIAEFLIRMTITYSSLVKYRVQNSRARMPRNRGHLAESRFPTGRTRIFPNAHYLRAHNKNTCRVQCRVQCQLQSYTK